MPRDKKHLYALTIALSLSLIGASTVFTMPFDCAFAANSACSYPQAGAPVSIPPGTPMNFVIIVTDDQRADTLQYMTNVTNWMRNNGTTFLNAYASPTSQCCPARASFLSGGLYSYQTQVLNNAAPNGGATQFYDGDTLPVRLQRAGYNTCIDGKYLNQYHDISDQYIPPGWTSAVILGAPASETHGYYNMSVVIGSTSYDGSGTGTKYTISNGTYVTDYLTDRALDCINAYQNQPFFLYLTYNAPHTPSTPPPQDEHLYDTFNFTSPATQETDFSDKPEYIQDNNYNAVKQQKTKDGYRSALETIPSVDRGIGRVMDRLNTLGLMDNTFVVFASDNGYEWGEHNGLGDKVKEYEESLKVPMVIRDPQSANLGARNSTELVSWTLDLPKTIANNAGVDLSHSRGTDLTPILRNEAHTTKTRMIFQAYGKDEEGSLPIYAAVRDGDWKYVELGTGEKELYNLATDPYELNSLHADSQYNSLMSTLSAVIDTERGLTILTTSLNNATQGVPYSTSLSRWGGAAPFTWSLWNNTSLPDGLILNVSTGVISGTPTTAGDYDFQVKVEDSSALPLTGAKQRHVAFLSLSVN